MKLADVSVHKLSKVFLARGRQWLASAKPFRRKTEVLPPDEALTVNPCYTATLAMYAKGKGDNGSVTIMDIGQQLVCNGRGVDSTSGESRVDIEYNGEPSVATVNYGNTSISIVITTGGVTVFSKSVPFVYDLPPTITVNGTYFNLFSAIMSTSKGGAVCNAEFVQVGVVDDHEILESQYQAWWLDSAKVVEAGLNNGTVYMSAVADNPVISMHSNHTDSGFRKWLVDNKIFISYSNGDAWPDTGLLLTRDAIIATEGNIVDYTTIREINRITYDCLSDTISHLETGFTGGNWGIGVVGPYDSSYTYWLVTRSASGDVQELQVSAQRFFYDGVEAGQTVWYDYPVLRGSGEINLIAHYTLDYAYTGPNTRTVYTAAVTIGQTRYTYDVLPSGANINEEMYYFTFGDYLYAGKVTTADGVELDALVYVYGTSVTHGYIAGPGNVLITTPTRRLTDMVCGLHGKITLAEDGYLEFNYPYRTLRRI